MQARARRVRTVPTTRCPALSAPHNPCVPLQCADPRGSVPSGAPFGREAVGPCPSVERQCSQSQDLGKRAALPFAHCQSPAGPTAGGQRGRASGVRVGQFPSSPPPPRWPQPCVSAGLESASGSPRTPHDLAHTHTHTPARTRSRRAVFPGPGPRLWEGPGSRASVARSGGARTTRVPAPLSKLCAPFPARFGAWAWPPALYPWARGGPGGSGRAAGGVGVRVGAAGSGPRGGSAPRRGKFGRGKLPPRPPRQEEGARGSRAPAPGLPLRPEARPPRRLPGRSRGPGGSLWLGSLPSAAIRLPLPRHPKLLPRGAARGSPQSCRLGALRGAGAPAPAGGRVPSPAAARRSRRESGRESGSRGGVCARVCERESARESEGVSERERGRVRV